METHPVPPCTYLVDGMTTRVAGTYGGERSRTGGPVMARFRSAVRAALAAALGATLLVGAPSAHAVAEPYVAPVNRSCGTWVLQQVGSAAELDGWAARIDAALALPGVVGLSLRVPWDALDEDPTLLDRGLALAEARGKEFTVRFMAGRWTPRSVFEEGAHSFVSAAGDVVPTPFGPDGSPGNPVFERAFGEAVGTLAQWSRAHGVHVLHVPWYGFLWAEIYNGTELEALPGYSWTAWLEGHRRLAEIALSHAGTDLAVELALSGHWGAHPQGGDDVADELVELAGPDSPVLIVQGNGFGRYDHRTTDRPIAHAKQMYDATDYDWPVLYDRLVANDERYLEVYTASFTRPSGLVLAAEVEEFAATCDTTPPSVTLDPPGPLLRGAAPLSASATDQRGLRRVEVLVDGSVVLSGSEALLSGTWDTTAVPDGLHRVSARATDVRGNHSTTAPVTVRVDNAPAPAMSVGPAQVVEGASGIAGARVAFTLSRPAHEEVTASYGTAGVTATGGEDFADRSGQVVFPVGVTEVVEVFAVHGDTADEPDETFTVTATAVRGGVLGTATGTVTILDDDLSPLPPPPSPTPTPAVPPAPPVTVRVDDASLSEGDSGTKKALLRVRLSRATAQAVTVAYRSVAGTARAGSDFKARRSTLRIRAGARSGVVAVAIRGDRVREARERFHVSFFSAVGATLTDAVGVVTVRDDDGPRASRPQR